MFYIGCYKSKRVRWIWRGTEKESEEMHSKFWPEDLKRRYILGDKDPENIKMGFKIQDMRMLSGVVSQDVSQWWVVTNTVTKF